MKDCGKRRYEDKRAALSQKNVLTKGRRRYRHNRPSGLRVYHCPDCKGWHLTKQGAES